MGVSQSGQLPPKPSAAIKSVAVRAAALADVLLAAVATLVDRVRDQNLATLKVSTEGSDVHAGARTMTKAKSALFAQRRRNTERASTAVAFRRSSSRPNGYTYRHARGSGWGSSWLVVQESRV